MTSSRNFTQKAVHRTRIISIRSLCSCVFSPSCVSPKGIPYRLGCAAALRSGSATARLIESPDLSVQKKKNIHENVENNRVVLNDSVGVDLSLDR